MDRRENAIRDMDGADPGEILRKAQILSLAIGYAQQLLLTIRIVNHKSSEHLMLTAALSSPDMLSICSTLQILFQLP
jgi:hypothetical protein